MSKPTRKNKQLKTRSTGYQWSKLKPYARNMRKEPTFAESVLWERLRRKQIGGFKFRRQHPVGNFIVDFYCSEAHLVIEIDGSIHDMKEQVEYDMNRQQFLEELGIRVIRFSNEDVCKQTNDVIECILQVLDERNE